jgi:small subunit ribosomal protein S8
VEIARILKEEGYISSFEVVPGDVQATLTLQLKYGPKRERVITGIRRISKPGLRVYAKKDELPRVLGGLGIAVISTSSGVMTDKTAKKAGVGGEVIAYVW